jgi:hypothetical protein
LVKPRRGTSSLGCLFTLLIVVAVVYFGINVGQIYFRFYEFQDDMKQAIRFAGPLTNQNILTRLRAQADSLGLPADARNITIKRDVDHISVETEYYERIELPGYQRDKLFHPHAEGPI